MTDTKYSDLVSRSSLAAAVMARDEEFFLAHLVDGVIQECDLFAATLKLFHFKGIVTLIDGAVVCKMASAQDLRLGCRASEHFQQGLENLPASQLALAELERVGKLEDPRT